MAITNENLLIALSKFKTTKDPSIVLLALADTTEDQYEKNFLIVYGSLRKNQYNYHALRKEYGRDSLVFIKSEEIEYAKLYDLGMYPAVLRGIYYDRVIGDIMYCNDKVFKVIEEMELNSGYKTSTMRLYERTSSGSMKTIPLTYYAADAKLERMIIYNTTQYPQVESGDWSSYLTNVIEA